MSCRPKEAPGVGVADVPGATTVALAPYHVLASLYLPFALRFCALPQSKAELHSANQYNTLIVSI